MAVAIPLIALAAGAAQAGYTAKRGHDAKVQAQHAEADQEQAVRAQGEALQSEQSKLDATTAARAARTRQRALLAGNQGNASTIATSPLGLADPASGGYSPLKTRLGE